jgi:hypothetical protein
MGLSSDKKVKYRKDDFSSKIPLFEKAPHMNRSKTYLKRATGRVALSALIVLLSAVSSAKSSCDSPGSDKMTALSVKTLLVKAVDENCPDLMDAVLKDKKSSELFAAAKEVTQNCTSAILSAAPKLKGKSGDDPAIKALLSRMKVLGAYGAFLKQKCPDENSGGDACSARSDFDAGISAMQESMSKLLAEEESDKSKQEEKDGEIDEISAAICSNQRQIGKHQALLDSEKKVGKASGYVNAKYIHDNTAMILSLQQGIATLKSRYKKAAGTSANKINCANYPEVD